MLFAWAHLHEVFHSSFLVVILNEWIYVHGKHTGDHLAFNRSVCLSGTHKGWDCKQN